MSQSIIAKLKKLYHHKTLRKAAIYGGMDEFHARYLIKDYIELLDESWTEVTVKNIRYKCLERDYTAPKRYLPL